MKPKPSTGGDFTPVPAGTHIARLIKILHIGTIITEYEGKKKKTDKILLTFELPNEKKVFDENKGEQPFLLSREDTFSFNERANLNKIVAGMIGRKLTEDEEQGDFDITTLLGITCLINVVHTDKGYAKIVSTSPLVKGMDIPAGINPTSVMDYEHWDEESFKKLPEFIRKKMETSDEYRKMKGLEPIELPKISDDDSQEAAYNALGGEGGEATIDIGEGASGDGQN